MFTKKILVVDDEDEMRGAVSTALEAAGFQVFGASDGQEGIESFLSYAPDLALLDIRMPKIGGIQLCHLIRHRSEIPIIMFSAVGERDEVVEAIKNGATDYVLKASGLAELVTRIGAFLEPDAASGGGGKTPGKASDQEFSLKENAVPVAVVSHRDRKASTEIKEVLRQSQLQVRECPTGAEALVAVRRFNPLLVVVENRLSDMTALELLTALKKHPRRGGIGVIIAADKKSPESQRRAKYHGAQDYVYGPWDDGRLATSVRSAMMNAQQFRDKVKKRQKAKQLAKSDVAKTGAEKPEKKKAPEAKAKRSA